MKPTVAKGEEEFGPPWMKRRNLIPLIEERERGRIGCLSVEKEGRWVYVDMGVHGGEKGMSESKRLQSADHVCKALQKKRWPKRLQSAAKRLFAAEGEAASEVEQGGDVRSKSWRSSADGVPI
ncbi:hypothetical protein LXL04_038830 [Taraxacum kok-saghyz]